MHIRARASIRQIVPACLQFDDPLPACGQWSPSATLLQPHPVLEFHTPVFNHRRVYNTGLAEHETQRYQASTNRYRADRKYFYLPTGRAICEDSPLLLITRSCIQEAGSLSSVQHGKMSPMCKFSVHVFSLATVISCQRVSASRVRSMSQL